MRKLYKRLLGTLAVVLPAALILLGVSSLAPDSLGLPSLVPDDVPGGDGVDSQVLPPGVPTVSDAQSQLDSLTVAPEGPVEDYDRSLFPHWNAVEDSCDAREYVLRRDGQDVQTDSECRATSGSWFSEYDGETVTDPSSLDIDHLVPLAEAWRSGAASWPTEQRASFANDIESAQLWAVTASTNRGKGDSDPANWMPPRTEIHCDYARAWIAVKHQYELTVDSEEHGTLQSVLDDSC